MSFIYSFTESDFIIGEGFNAGSLHREILTDLTLAPLIEGIKTLDASLDIYFSRELDAGEYTILESFIEAHAPAPLIEAEATVSVSPSDAGGSGFLTDKLVSGSNVTVDVSNPGGSEFLTLSSPNQVNTVANINTSGFGLYEGSNGLEFQFRGIRSTSSKFYLAFNNTEKTLDLDVVSGAIPHRDLQDSGSYPHIAIDAHIANVTPNPHNVLATQITDFDTEVSNNSDVSSNTSSRGEVNVSATDVATGTLDSKIGAGSNIVLTKKNTGSNEYLEISCPTAVGEANTASNVGASGVGLFKQKIGVDLEFKKLNAGSSLVEITQDAESNMVYLDIVESSLSLTASQITDFDSEVSNNPDVSSLVSSSSKVKASSSDTTANYLENKLLAGSNLYIDKSNAGGNETLTIGLSGDIGEANTASNVNTQGIGVFETKSGIDMQFRGIYSSSNRLGVTLDGANKAIALDLVVSNISHNDLADVGVYSHSQIDSHISSSANPHNVTASLLSDFDFEVENNSVVVANTSARGKLRVTTSDTTLGVLADKLSAGSNITLTTLNPGTDESYEIAFSGTLGETNTASNIGTSGFGLYDSKVGSVLRFKNLVANSPLFITENVANKYLDFSLDASLIQHSTLDGVGTNTHAQIDTHLSDSTVHFIIDDSSSLSTVTLSASEIDNRIQQAQLSAYTLKGDWDASTNTPTLSSGAGVLGDLYRVSVTGSTLLDGVSDWTKNDQLYFDGSAWRKIDNTESVSSVNGYTGAVVLNTDDVSEGTNKYYADSLVEANTTVVSLVDSKSKVSISSTDSTYGFLEDKLVAGSNVNLAKVGLDSNPQTYRIDVDLSSVSYSASNVNTQGVGVFDYLDGTNFRFLGIAAGSSKLNIFRNASNAVEIDLIPSNIDHTTLSNVGSLTHAELDSHVYSQSNPHNVLPNQISGLDTFITNNSTVQANTGARFKSKISSSDTTGDHLENKISSGTGISILKQGTGAYESLQISSTIVPGETNTASNVNTLGYGFFEGKVGSDLQFRGISAGSNKVLLNYLSASKTVSIDVDFSTLSHTSLSDIGTLTHAELDSHVSDLSIHREIDDSSSSNTALLSSAEIDSRIATIQGNLTYPPHFQVASSVPISTTTSSNWQQKVTLTTPVLEAGTYKITFNYMWNYNSSSSDFNAAITYDGYQKFYQFEEPADSGGSFASTGTDQRYIESGVLLVNETRQNLSHNIILYYRTSLNGIPASIWNTFLTIEKVGDINIGAPEYDWVVDEPAL